MHSVWTHVHYMKSSRLIGNGHVPSPSWHLMCLLFCVLLKFCNYFGWLAISLKTHPCTMKEINVLWRHLFLNIRCKTLMWVSTGYYLHVCWNCCILDICMMRTVACDVIYVIVLSGNVARLFCRKWVNFIPFILLLVEKQGKKGSFHF